MADTAPQKLNTAAQTTTATVEPEIILVINAHTGVKNILPELATILPIREDSMNWARNTMQLTMAMSVPMPRTW